MQIVDDRNMGLNKLSIPKMNLTLTKKLAQNDSSSGGGDYDDNHHRYPSGDNAAAAEQTTVVSHAGVYNTNLFSYNQI
ncbi:unnamed protein product [Euphydryas editha]|uniref:Uncharacterized protein n=1 Tax=Euphydryas editha TaxID=104508 RepID=A0AAU9TIM3_EUPED|nr:unnamed protein product [Euphydryas editha]